MFCLKTGKDIAVVENNKCGCQKITASEKFAARVNKQTTVRKYTDYVRKYAYYKDYSFKKKTKN